MRNQPGAVERVPAGRLAELIGLIAAGTITATIAKQVYALLEAEPGADRPRSSSATASRRSATRRSSMRSWRR